MCTEPRQICAGLLNLVPLVANTVLRMVPWIPSLRLDEMRLKTRSWGREWYPCRECWHGGPSGSGPGALRLGLGGGKERLSRRNRSVFLR